MKQLVGTARNLMHVVVEGDAGHDRKQDRVMTVGMSAELVLMLADNEWTVDRKGKTLTKRPTVETVKFLVTFDAMESLIRNCATVLEEMRALQGALATRFAASNPEAVAEQPKSE